MITKKFAIIGWISTNQDMAEGLMASFDTFEDAASVFEAAKKSKMQQASFDRPNDTHLEEIREVLVKKLFPNLPLDHKNYDLIFLGKYDNSSINYRLNNPMYIQEIWC